MITRRTAFNDLPEYLSVAELAAYLGISRTMAYDYARQHGVRFGSLIRVPKLALPHATADISKANQPLSAVTREQMIELIDDVMVRALLRSLVAGLSSAVNAVRTATRKHTR